MSDPAYANVNLDGLTDAMAVGILDKRQTAMHEDILNLMQRLERVEAVPEVVAALQLGSTAEGGQSQPRVISKN